MVSQRVSEILCGYEDANDCNQLWCDSAMLNLVDKLQNEGLAIMDKRKAFAFLENVSYFRFQHIKNK